jgi:hypothetical protein
MSFQSLPLTASISEMCSVSIVDGQSLMSSLSLDVLIADRFPGSFRRSYNQRRTDENNYDYQENTEPILERDF